MRLKQLTAVAVIVGALSGCGGDQQGSAATDRDAAPTVEQSASQSASASPDTSKIGPYIDLLAARDSASQQQASEAAAPGSLAAAYAKHQAAGTLALEDGGGSDIAGEVTEDGTGFRVCYPAEEGEDDSCLLYDNFKLDPSGAVASFTIDDKPLEGRLTVGNGQTQQSRLGDVTFISAYRTQAGQQAVAVSVKSKAAELVFFTDSAKYRAPDGRQRVYTDFNGPGKLAPDSVANFIFFFNGPIEFGGTLALELADNDNPSDSLILDLKTN